MKKRLLSMFLICAMTLSMAACGNEEVVDETPVEDNAEVVEEADPYAIFDEVSTEGKVRSYLTGEWVDEEIGRSRPVAMMIENTKACLPQYGYEKAGVVYECTVEGNITRTMAIFDDYSGMDRMGNLRSSRPYFVYFASEYEAIYAHAGGNPAAFELIDKGLVNNLNFLDGDIGKHSFRSSDAQAPHNLYTSSEGLKNSIEMRKYDTTYSSNHTPHFTFATETENTLSDGEDCAAVKFYYSTNRPYWIYNSTDKKYYRYEFDQKQIDAITGNQITATNIIIQNCSWFEYTGSDYIGFDLPGNTGTGKFLTNGKMVDITWSKDGETDVTHYYYSNGEEIKLNVGVTWIQLCQDTKTSENEYYKTEADFK